MAGLCRGPGALLSAVIGRSEEIRLATSTSGREAGTSLLLLLPLHITKVMMTHGLLLWMLLPNLGMIWLCLKGRYGQQEPARFWGLTHLPTIHGLARRRTRLTLYPLMSRLHGLGARLGGFLVSGLTQLLVMRKGNWLRRPSQVVCYFRLLNPFALLTMSPRMWTRTWQV
ncbi:hypothetical protein E2C01_051091 [Portunus trituberculatus]|uniref:Uncharacterized protein n=1 Tax=Portunus trituberculatus TaxID=210409 RepID=A0A5B7GIM1_PORTR|nr:hypothetical protein [Portunus trituberculatus]